MCNVLVFADYISFLDGYKECSYPFTLMTYSNVRLLMTSITCKPLRFSLITALIWEFAVIHDVPLELERYIIIEGIKKLEVHVTLAQKKLGALGRNITVKVRHTRILGPRKVTSIWEVYRCFSSDFCLSVLIRQNCT